MKKYAGPLAIFLTLILTFLFFFLSTGEIAFSVIPGWQMPLIPCETCAVLGSYNLILLGFSIIMCYESLKYLFKKIFPGAN